MSLVDENGSTLVPVPLDGPLDEVEASSLTAGAQGYGDDQKHLRDSVTGRGHCKPESGRSTNGVRKTMFGQKKTKTKPKRPHTVPGYSEGTQYRGHHRGRTKKTHS